MMPLTPRLIMVDMAGASLTVQTKPLFPCDAPTDKTAAGERRIDRQEICLDVLHDGYQRTRTSAARTSSSVE